MYFLAQDNFQDIFNIFFGPRAARVEKYVENVKRFIENQENTRESKLPS